MQRISMGMRRMVLAALAVVLAGCVDQPTGISPAPREAAPPAFTLASGQSPFGINVNQTNYLPWGPPALDKVVNAGVGWIRMDFDWRHIQPTQGGPFVWDSVDNTVAFAHDKGLSILGVLGYTPTWANNDPTPFAHRVPPTDMNTWKAFVTAATTRYAGKVQAWGIWNEPNCPGFYTTRNNFADYDSLLAFASGPIHATGATLVAGQAAMGACGDVIAWLNGRLAANVDSINVVAVHGYGVGSYIVNTMVNIHFGLWADKPLWLTEVGEAQPNPSLAGDAIQAEQLFDTYRGMMFYNGWWKKTFQYHLYVWTPSHEYGILRGTGLQERPAYNTYRLIAAGCVNNPDCVAMHRWYRQDDHLFGSSPNEGYGSGYSYHGSPFKVASQAFNSRMVPLYRCRRVSTNQHFLTDSSVCDGVAGTQHEGTWGYMVSKSHGIPNSAMRPLYRLYYPGNGTWYTTILEDERAGLLAMGHVDQGIIGYVWP